MIKSYNGKMPCLAEGVHALEGCAIIGDVTIGENSSVWYNAVVRGDVNSIRIGKYTNIQDLTMIHCTLALWPATIGDYVTVGHSCTLHGCTIGNNVIVGMGSVILDGAVVGENSIVGAGSLILERKQYPPGVLIAGSPAVVKRELREEEIDRLKQSAQHYHHTAKNHCGEND